MTFVFSLTQIFVFLSRHAMFNILLSIFVCAAANVFFAWLVSAHVSAPYDIASVVDLSLQAGSSVTLEDVAVHGECCPSLNLLVLVIVSGSVSLSQVIVAFNVHDLVLLPYFGVSLYIYKPLSSTCPYSDHAFHIHQLIPVALVVFHVVY